MKKIVAFISSYVVFSAIIFILHQVFLKKILHIHNISNLIWTFILVCFIGFYVSGIITKKLPLKLLPILYLQLILFVLIHKFYFPLNFAIILASTCGLIIVRKEISSVFKIISTGLLIVIFGYFLFSQPLIIEKKGFKYSKDGNLANAYILWDNSSDEKKLPELHIYNVNDKKINLNLLLKEKTIITFWASWCGTCRAERPALENLKNKYKNNNDIQFIDISIDISEKSWKNYLKNNNLKGIQLLSKNIGKDKAELNIVGIPYYIIASKNGLYKFCPSLTKIDKLLTKDQQNFNNFLVKKSDLNN